MTQQSPTTSVAANRSTGLVSSYRLSFVHVRFLLAVILLTAATLKAELLVASELWEIALVVLELSFAAWLLTLRLPRITWWASLACFGSFACVAAMKMFRGEADCGCFGVIETSPSVALTIDIAAIGLLLFTGSSRNKTPTSNRSSFLSRLPAATGYALILLVSAKLSLSVVENDSADLAADGMDDPASWVGKRFPLLDSIDIGGQLGTGRWTAVLHRHGCPMCEEVLECVSRLAGSGSSFNRIALIELPPFPNRQGAATRSRVVRGQITSRNGRALQTPIVVWLDGGQVTASAVGPQCEGRLNDLASSSHSSFSAASRDTIASMERIR